MTVVTGPDPEVSEAVGWRVFALGDDGMLRSPWVQTQVEPDDPSADWPTRSITARCLFADHEAPDPDCACGVYATADLHALLPAYGEVGLIARVQLTGRVLPGARIPVDDPVTTVRGTTASLVELHLRHDLTRHVPALIRRYPGLALLPYPRSVTAEGPRTWTELITPPARETALGGHGVPQVDRAERMKRRGYVEVNAATLFMASRLLRAFWEVPDGKLRPSEVARAWAGAWQLGATEAEKKGLADLMPPDGWSDPGNRPLRVVRDLADDLLYELEAGRPSTLGGGRLIHIPVFTVDSTIVFLQAWADVYGGIDVRVAVTDATAAYMGRVIPDSIKVSGHDVRGTVQQIINQVDGHWNWPVPRKATT